MTGPSSRALWQPAMHSSGLRRLGLACRVQSDTPVTLVCYKHGSWRLSAALASSCTSSLAPPHRCETGRRVRRLWSRALAMPFSTSCICSSCNTLHSHLIALDSRKRALPLPLASAPVDPTASARANAAGEKCECHSEINRSAGENGPELRSVRGGA